MEALIPKEELYKLIPQRSPILLVDQLLTYENDKAVSTFYVSPDHIFVNKQGFLVESGLIENMAQTTAMHLGYEYYLQGIPAPEGYIGSIRKLKIFDLPKVKATIETHITRLNEILGVTIVEGEVFYNNEVIACGEMRLVQSR